MKREGRQHGMVRTHMVPLNHTTKTNNLSSTQTAGIFTRVPQKPTNHSKFTGKCTGRSGCLTCHQHPATKSKNKTKGTHKLKSTDIVCNAGLVSWGVVDGEKHQRGLFNLKSCGFSAKNILDQLESSYHSNNTSFYDDDAAEYSIYDDDGLLLNEYLDKLRVDGELVNDHDHEQHDDDDDDVMSFCELGYVMYDEIEGDEDWCLVAEM